MAEQKKKGPWQIRCKNRTFHSPDGYGPHKLRFVEGVVQTADEAAARFAAECGHEVTDLATKEVVNPLTPTMDELVAMNEANAKKAAAKK